MNQKTIPVSVENLVIEKVKNYDGGHDWWHIMRVRKLSKYINDKENLEDPLLVDLAALFHDFADSKFSGENSDADYNTVIHILTDNELERYVPAIVKTMKEVSFSSRMNSPTHKDSLLQIIQDADRLDAIGAIGIARAFNYGGYRNNIIYSPVAEENCTSTINHFYDKLLLLKGMMNTETGKSMAHERHSFLEIFLDQFHKEWKAGSI